MAEEVAHVCVEEEDFDSAVMECVVESHIDDIHSYLSEPGFSAEDLRHTALEEAAAAQAVHYGCSGTCKFSFGLSKWEYEISFTFELLRLHTLKRYSKSQSTIHHSLPR